MSTVIYPSPVFGPVQSRRLGVSLGINLLPADGKVCSFDCIYCECGWNDEHKGTRRFNSLDDVKELLQATLQRMVGEGTPPDVITFAGNGEPTMHPEFEKVIDATIATEDKHFYKHMGFDYIRIMKAIISNVTSGSLSEGASTITQQYARNLFLTMDKTWKRKLSEMMIALNLESKYSKVEILEGYLNSIYFDHGIYGIEDASIYYFGKSSNELNLAESVCLAAIPKGPAIYSPLKNPDNNKERKTLILNELLSDKKITQEEYIDALNYELQFTGYNPNNKSEVAPYFQDYVLTELKKIPIVKEYASSGLKVYTTLNLSLNNDMTESVINRIENDLEVSIVAVEPSTGKILSLIGGKDYSKSTFNRAVNAHRQPASTIKPFLYLTALENGFTESTTFTSEKTTFYVKK